MPQEPNDIEMIDDEDIAVLADMINEAFPDEEGADVVAETAVAEEIVAEGVVAEEVMVEEALAEDEAEAEAEAEVMAEDVITEDAIAEDVMGEEGAVEEIMAADEAAADIVAAAEEMAEGAGSEGAETAAVDHLRLIEALLFASAEPLTVKAIRERMPEDADVGGLLMTLQKNYEGRGVVLLNMDGHWAFRTATDLSDALSMKKDVQRKLSKVAMETLAIVAYHQPVTRPEIENIRGVAISNGTLDVLMECGWVKPGKRRETPGRPLTWVTSSAFLDHFGLTALRDLPGMAELKDSGLLDARPAIDVTTGNLFGEEDKMLSEDLKDSDINDEHDDDNYDARMAGEEGLEEASEESEESLSGAEEAAAGEMAEAMTEGAFDEERDEEEGAAAQDLAEEDSDAEAGAFVVSDDSDDSDEDEDEGEAWDDLNASNDDEAQASDDEDEEVA